MSATAFEVAGALLACCGGAAALLLRDPRWRYGAVGLALFGAVALIAGDVWDQPRFQDLRSDPAAVGAAIVFGGIALGATAATFVRVPAAFAIAVFAVISLRIPVQVGGETNFLLVPLYGVIAGGWLRAVWLLARGRAEELQNSASPRADARPLARWLCVALAASLVVYGIGVAWTDDPTNATRNVAFFLAPFAGLLALLRDLRWHRKLLGQVLGAVVAVGALMAVLALWQYATRELILNQDLQAANQLHIYFRANALFRDPNILGRYLVFAIVALGAWIAWGRRPTGQMLGATAVAALLLAGLAVTFSQTSFMALAGGLGALVCLRLRWRGFALALGMGVTAAAVFLALGGMPESDVAKERNDLAEVSSGRANLITGGIELFERRPIAGWGSGSFTTSFRREIERIKKPVSHNEPITVAAEQGVLGLIPYLAVVGLAIALLVSPWPRTAGKAAVAGCFAALLVHSLGYAGFAIDPATWALLALGLVLRE